MNSSTLTSKLWLLTYLVALLGAVGLGWVYTMRFEPETGFWARAFEERRVVLEKATDVPKVIFTGDSACSFAIDPVVFREGTGMPSYNLGGTRQMGMRLFMGEASKYVSEGDVMVLICNPQLFVAEEMSHPKAGARMALRLDEGIAVGEFLDATRPGFSHLVKHAAKVGLRKPMFRYGAGDHHVLGQVTTSARDHAAPTKVVFESDGKIDKAVEVLEIWRAGYAATGVTLCYLMPVELTDESVLAENRARKRDFMEELERRVPGVVMLQIPENGCSDDESLFADTLYHLTEEAAADFTRKLTPILVEALRD